MDDATVEAPMWDGFAERECGEHRTTGGRAWCFADSEWCYEHIPCRGCELPALRAEVERLRALPDPRPTEAEVWDKVRVYWGWDHAAEVLRDLGCFRPEPAAEHRHVDPWGNVEHEVGVTFLYGLGGPT